MHTTSSKLSVRWAAQCDLTALAAIDAACFDAAWPRGRWSRALVNRSSIVMLCDRVTRGHGFSPRISVEPLGLMVFRLHPVLSGTWEITRIGVHPSARRQGVGTALLGHFGPSRLGRHCGGTILIDVPDDRLEAHLFLAARGFRAEAICPDPARDAHSYVFVRESASGLDRCPTNATSSAPTSSSTGSSPAS